MRIDLMQSRLKRNAWSLVAREWKRAVVILAAAFQCANAQAATNGFVVPTVRGAVESRTGYWEVFTVGVGEPGNLADKPGATTQAVLRQLDPNAFVTGSGNIYNLETSSSFTLTDSVPQPVGTVVLQTRSVGSELDYNSVTLKYSTESGEQAVAPLFRYELDRASGQGVNVSSLWQWDLTGLGVKDYVIAFKAAGPSLSFDSLTLDTAPAFAPAFAAQPFAFKSAPANLARWMYPFNSAPANRATASAFGSLGSSPDFDSRDAQYLLGWNTGDKVITGQGTGNYLIRRARVTLTIASGNQYAYTGTLRDYRSYFPPADPRHVAPTTTSSPVELFGTGFRGGFTAATYPQDGPWGVDPEGGFHENRAAYAAGYNTAGALVDVSNNVGDDETTEIANPFEVAPFAVGQSATVAPGERMPVGSQLTFDLNLDDPFIYGYLQQALNDGRLSLTVCSFVAASLGGPPTYPNFYTIFSPIARPDQFPILDLEGEVVRPGVDGDADGLPDDWENFQFGSLQSAAAGDADSDGATALAEYRAGTNPSSIGSALRLLSVSRQGGATELRFSFSASRTYKLEWSDDLIQWQRIENPTLNYSSAWLSKSSANVSYPSAVYAVWKDAQAQETPYRFYRVGAQ